MQRFLVLVCAFLGVVAAIVATGRLQADATTGRNAELQLTALRLDIAQIQDVPWGASPDEGDDPSEVRGELESDQRRIETSLIALRRESGLEDGAITAPFERGVTALWVVLNVIADGGSADDAGAASSFAAHQLSAADTGLQAAAKHYRSASARALTRAQLQSGAVVALLFAAFAWCFWRVAKARRTAERLAEENERLLVISQAEALTDWLTGLGNRRALRADLTAMGEQRLTLALFDLNGFKQYNDTFGHPAGDALLSRLGERLAATLEGIGTAYRMGGDEFCIVAAVQGDEAGAIASLAASALTESGDGFTIECAYGVASMPGDTTDADHALSLADQRMYAHKSFRRTDVLT
jgi:diguanylate cyclase (GGDEF)-like protein